MKIDVEKYVRSFKKFCVSVVHGLFEEEPIRHQFEPVLVEEFLNVLKKYAAPGMEDEISVCWYISNDGVPCIQIVFFPDQPINAKLLQTLLRRLKTKLSHYLLVRSMNWRIFGTYCRFLDEVHFFLYYAEFPDDYDKFIKKYRIFTLEKTGNGFGFLGSQDIDDEIRKNKRR